MAQKAEIQYISQFCDYGSDAETARKRKAAREARRREREARVRTIAFDPVAVCAILSAIVLCTALVLGGMTLHSLWKEHRSLQSYLTQLKTENGELQHKYRLSYNLDDIRTMAGTLGLVPEEDMEVRYVRVTPPRPKQDPTFLDNLKWFFKGLFA